MTHCEYCGTGLDDEGEIEDATGERHYMAKCREYVFQVKQHAKSEVARLRAALEEVASAHPDGNPARLIALARTALASPPAPEAPK